MRRRAAGVRLSGGEGSAVPQPVPDTLIDLIYDAATEAALWPRVIAAIADLLGSEGGVLFGLSIARKRVHFTYDARLDPESHRVHEQRHIQNVWSRVMMHKPAGSIVFSDEILPEADLVGTEFRHDILRPQGLIRNAMVPVTRSGHFQSAFNILRTPGQGPFAERDRAVLGWIVPHLKRAMQLQLRVEAHEALAGAQFAVLDCLAMGVVVLDRTGAVLFANEAARALHAAGGPILLKDGTLTALVPGDAAALHARLRAVAEGRAGGAVRLTDPGGARTAFALVAPLRGRMAGILDDEGLRCAAAAVFVSAGPPPPADPRTMMRLYDLTPAEARVAAELAQGRSYAAIAGSLGISINTVKTHMRRILAKAGVERPAEFASLAATLQLVRL
ncbi:hypothetical protein GMJLKIPL_5144 [Methylobacterium isbiliense]|uniref:HTH luxR-type domain-containing protein n=1 Tax=Methylobacterium isbiliense TaxID=315478 RepID=A0ABQ4SL92_9HYPH|nr:hypothetical protein GMJLKIPL_5144 [Methylobacterium isbiliense]